ncbi:fibronectin type III domain-containing protein [Corallococcus sp. AB032C]|uniref:fibronectin type III domain-containing protein n=1 Tax=Corallococcus TaxID=83461 RepID=UPI000ED05D37|nr:MULTISPECIES: fibronectin type III domain-containing protein [Corallococcus]NPC46775.1 fibronectin type III domain-containing protein [Corallococcus exiguus]RKH87387.1 fibronectin type III domain-containing protein [Corallococcus sp. AB032C]
MKKFAFARHRVLCFAGAFLLSLSCGPQDDLTPDLDETGEVSQAALAAPTLLEAVPGDGQVTLKWTAGPAGTQGYQVRFRVGSGSWVYRGAGTSTTYAVTGLTNGTKYEFHVRIKGSTGDTTSGYSNGLSATPIADECSGSSVRHITVTGAGSKDGLTAQTAGTLSNLNAFIQAVGPGGMVCIHGGTYGTGTTVSQGGALGAPVTIKGVEGRPIFQSTFQASTRAKTGPVAFTVKASNLVFHNLEFSHVGTCFSFKAATSVAHVTLSQFRAENVATCVDVERSSSTAFTDLTIRDAMILQFTRGGIFLASGTNQSLVEDVYVDMEPEQIGGQGSDYPVGIALYDTTNNVTLRRATVMNVTGMQTGYTQGDGIDGESTASDVVLEDSYFRGNEDGCVDTKVRNMLIRNTVAAECKRNFRLWQSVSPGPRVENVSSYQPRDGHFFMHSGTTTAKDIAVYSSNGAKLVAYDCSSSSPCTFNAQGIRGTLLDAAKLNATGTVTGNALVYGQSVTIPPVPNPTSFTP